MFYRAPLLALATLFVLSNCKQPEPRVNPEYRYRVVTADVNLFEQPDIASDSVSKIQIGSQVMETGVPGKPTLTPPFIHVAYWGEVGWLNISDSATPDQLRTQSSAEKYFGIWRSTVHCENRPGFFEIRENQTFTGIRCIYCAMEGCPDSISGVWHIDNGRLCMKESRGEQGCLFIWKDLLIADSDSGFIWEHHGGFPMSGLRR